MLSYQHIYHAGNAADVHKHAALAVVLEYMTRKDKPLTYIETHAGRGLYDLSAKEAVQTGEAALGITRMADQFSADHPYAQARAAIGDTLYPGSPAIAQVLTRPQDRLHLAELHPQEFRALRQNLRDPRVHCHQQDGYDLAVSLCPPTPRRGVMLIDPSYEIKDEYARLPKVLSKLVRKWNVGVILVWYPILSTGAERGLVAALDMLEVESLHHRVSFPPARAGHRMIGSGLFVVNPPFGLKAKLAETAKIIEG